jgi:restriction system protein
MARKSGFAQIQRAIKTAAREAERSANARAREHQAAIRRAEQARRAEERAAAQVTRAADAERKRMEKEAKAAHVEAMQAEVDARNAALEDLYDEIDGLLAATLDVDDFVDLESLRDVAEHPPFASEHEHPLPPPERLVPPPEPVLNAPPAPSGLSSLFGKKKHAEAVAAAEAAHAYAVTAWQVDVQALPAKQAELDAHHSKAEGERVRLLAEERVKYDAECSDRDAEVAERNAELDQLIANLGYGTTEAVEEYVSIVLANAVYPESFPVESEFSFDPATAELSLRALVPGPDKVSNVKDYKYVKASDEITSTTLSQKAQKDRYNDAVQQVALRLLHEVFEADRRGIMKSISLELGTETIDPATGKHVYVPFVAAAAERDTFLAFDLSAVVPAATLGHLGAAVSKNPLGLVPADTRGIRST